MVFKFSGTGADVPGKIGVVEFVDEEVGTLSHGGDFAGVIGKKGRVLPEGEAWRDVLLDGGEDGREGSRLSGDGGGELAAEEARLYVGLDWLVREGGSVGLEEM